MPPLSCSKMNESQKSLLKRYHQRLAEDIIVTEDLLGELYQSGIFQKGMIELIRAERTNTDKIQRLLEMLPKRGPDALDQFVEVLETSYPWLATLLASAQAKPQTQGTDAGRKHSGQHQVKAVTSTTPASADNFDGDIKKLVQAFVHRQFGQSKRISEKDKKSVERFVSEQVQRERTRYQSMLASTTCNSPCSDMDTSRDSVFQSGEIQEHLFSMHIRMEPHIMEANDNSTTSHKNNDNGSSDDKDNNHHNSQQQNSNSRPFKLMPEDMDFKLIATEVEVLLGQKAKLEGQLEEMLEHFDPKHRHEPLPFLVGDLVRRCQGMEEDMDQDRQQITHLLNKCNTYSDQIERLEKERLEHRNQIQALYLDMAALRQDKVALQDKLQKMNQEMKHSQAERDRSKDGLRLGYISKSVKTTPRNGNILNSSLNPNGASGCGGGADDGPGGPNGSRRGMIRVVSNRPNVTYTGYSRKYQTVTSRYAMANKKKTAPKDGNMSSSTKF